MSSHAEDFAGIAVKSLEVIPWFSEAFWRLGREERKEIRDEMVHRFSEYLKDNISTEE